MQHTQLPLSWELWLVLSVASWRLTRLLAKDTFPPIYKVRSMILDRWPDLPNFDTYVQLKNYVDFERREGRQLARPYWVGYLVTCMWCMSAYVSLFIVTAAGGHLPLSRAGFLSWLAVWGGTLIAARIGG